MSILFDCLEELSLPKYNSFIIIVLVHKIELFEDKNYSHNISFRAYPQARKSYFFRLYYEFWAFGQLSRKLKPYLWFSLHDISPKVFAEKKTVYWQSPSPFYSPCWSDIWNAPELFVHSFLYRFVLQFNHQSNDFIIVQQQWIREKVSQWFNIPLNKVIVAYPINEVLSVISQAKIDETIPTFFYPSLPRTQKNFEVLGQACEILVAQKVTDFELVITINGKENQYSRQFFKKYEHISQLKLIGILDRNSVFDWYEQCTALVFPSKLETWGLPISEFEPYQKPILVGDLPYAKETVGDYSMAKLLPVNDAEQWAGMMKKIILKEAIEFDKTEKINIPNPKADNWGEVFDTIL